MRKYSTRVSMTHRALISGVYSTIAAFLATVPFPTRGKGLSGFATRIISMKIRLNAGATLFASSTKGLHPVLAQIKAHIRDFLVAYQIKFLNSTKSTPEVACIGSTRMPIWFLPCPKKTKPPTNGEDIMIFSNGPGTTFSPNERMRTSSRRPTLNAAVNMSEIG